MESYLRSHPVVRWLLILTLLCFIAVEALLIGSRVGAGSLVPTGDNSQGGGADVGPTATTASPIGCQTVDFVNLRRGPSTEFAIIAVLDPLVPLTALGRSGDVPWLLVQLGDGQQGWLSSRTSATEVLVECEGELLTLPESGEPISAANQAEGEPSPTAAPSVTPQPTLTPAPSVRLRSGNGPDLHAARRTFDVVLDGNLSEWGNTSAAPIGNAVAGAETWSGPQDLSGLARAAWDEQFLYLALQVTDDVIVQESQRDQLYRGDTLELYWDADLQGDFDEDRYSEDDMQFAFSPGNFAENPPSAWAFFTAGDLNALLVQIVVGTQRTEVGYTLEVRVPWLGLRATPQPNNIFGYALALSDDDTAGSGEQESQLSMTLQTPFDHPTRWSNLILEP